MRALLLVIPLWLLAAGVARGAGSRSVALSAG